MAKYSSLMSKWGVALLLVGGALFVPLTNAQAQSAVKPSATTKASAPKTIRLGVDPDQYLRNRHKRVHRARRQANIRSGSTATLQPVAYQKSTTTNKSGRILGSNIPKEYEGAPGFNDFSHLSEDEKAHAEEIMQFLKAYQQ